MDCSEHFLQNFDPYCRRFPRIKSLIISPKASNIFLLKIQGPVNGFFSVITQTARKQNCITNKTWWWCMVEERRKSLVSVLKIAFCFHVKALLFYSVFHNPLNFNLLMINGKQTEVCLPMIWCIFSLLLLSLQYQNLLTNFFKRTWSLMELWSNASASYVKHLQNLLVRKENKGNRNT